MKKSTQILGLLLLFGVILLPLDTLAQRGYGMMGPGGRWGPGDESSQEEGWFCPNCGRWQGGGRGMGYGMMGPGMMHRGWDRDQDPYYSHRYNDYDRRYDDERGDGPDYQRYREPLEKKDAEAILRNYLRSTRNPNLKLGKVEEKNAYFQAEILTKNGSLVDKMMVDKNTGWIRSAY